MPFFWASNIILFNISRFNPNLNVELSHDLSYWYINTHATRVCSSLTLLLLCVCRVDPLACDVLQPVLHAVSAGSGHVAGALPAAILQGQEAHWISHATLNSGTSFISSVGNSILKALGQILISVLMQKILLVGLFKFFIFHKTGNEF